MIKWLKSLFKRVNSLDELAQWAKDDPVLLSYWLLNHIWYHKDKSLKENWQDVNEAFKNRASDCEEMAAMFYYCVTKWGYKAKLMSIFNDKTGHAICCFWINNRWSYFDFSGINATGKKIIGEIPKLVYTDVTEWYITDMKGNRI